MQKTRNYEGLNSGRKTEKRMGTKKGKKKGQEGEK